MNAVLHKQHLRRGFTLVELVVVLMILVGLAAVLIPAVTDMVNRTNRSTAASNIAGAMQRYDAQYMSLPDNLDGLMTDLTGTDLDTLSSGLTGITADVTLSANTLATLNNSGINNVGIHAVGDATFDLPTITALTNTTKLKGLTDTAQEALGLETSGVSGKYIVLGVGPLCDMNGKTMFDAPVHFPRDPNTNPIDTYCRFIVVLQITDGTTALNRAKFVGILAPDGIGLSSELDGYFQVTNLK